MSENLVIGYITNIYARASDTFIRGEVLQLRDLGHTVHTFSIRRAIEDQHVSEEIEREQATTDYILSHGLFRLLISFLCWCVRSPRRMLSTLCLAWQTCSPGVRAAVWQLAYLLEAAYLAQRVRKLGIQHLHNHLPVGVGTVTMLAANLAGVPYSFTAHGTEVSDRPEYWALGAKVRTAHFAVAVCEYGRSQLYRWCDFHHWSKIHVVRCGLNGLFLQPRQTEVTAAHRLVCIARFSSEKGHLVLVQAAGQLAALGLEFELVLVGDGPMRARTEEAISTRNLATHVRITGWASGVEVRDHILNARAMVLPSFAEGLPIVLMEAMALGRPVISTWVAGIPELVENGVNGWLVPPGDVDALAKAMRDALAAPVERLTEMGQAGAVAVRSRHDARVEVQQLVELFRSSASS